MAFPTEPESLPRLVSDSDLGLASGALSSPLTGLKTEKPEMPAGTGLEIKPDLPGRILAGDKIGSLTPGGDLSIGLVKSRLINLRPAEDETKEK